MLLGLGGRSRRRGRSRRGGLRSAGALEVEHVVTHLLAAAPRHPVRDQRRAIELQCALVDVGVLGGVQVRAAREHELQRVLRGGLGVQLHLRLVAHGAVVRHHQLRAIQVVHGDHLVRRAGHERLHHGRAAGGEPVGHGRGERLGPVARHALPLTREGLQALEGGLGIHLSRGSRLGGEGLGGGEQRGNGDKTLHLEFPPGCTRGSGTAYSRGG